MFIETKGKSTAAHKDDAIVSQNFFLTNSSRSAPHLKSLFLQYC